jgi:hypothetical protein
MSSLSIAELNHAAAHMGIYGGYDISYTPEEREAEDDKFKKMPAESPRTSLVQTFFTNVGKLGKFAIKWVKETLPQKIAIYRFHREEKNSINALRAAIASEKFEEKVEKFKSFVEYYRQLAFMDGKDSRLPKTVWNSYNDKLSELVQQDFDKLDLLVEDLDNACAHPCVEPKVFKELEPVHKSIVKFLKFYAKSDDRCRLIASSFRYLKFSA